MLVHVKAPEVRLGAEWGKASFAHCFPTDHAVD